MLGSRIRERRRQLGLSQEALSELTNISQNMISRYETSLSSPTAETLITLASALKTSSDYLLGLTDSPHPHEPSDLLRAVQNRMALESILKTPLGELLKRLGYAENGDSEGTPATSEARLIACIVDRMSEEDRQRAVRLIEALANTSSTLGIARTHSDE